MTDIQHCKTCNEYTTKDNCTKGHRTTSPRPARYQATFKHQEHRREARRKELTEKKLL